MSHLNNDQVASVFSRLADLMEIRGDNAFRIRAFRRVAQAVENLSESVATMLAEGTLKEVPGIGAGTVTRIEEIMEKGTCDDLLSLQAEMPAGLFDLLLIGGLGPKKVKLFYDELGISSVDQLEAAARAGDLANLPRMGKKSQDKLLNEIERFRRRTGRVPLGLALPQGEAIVAALQENPHVEQVSLAGSCRRRKETIGDLDVLVASSDVATVMDQFVQLENVAEVMLRGDTKCSVRLDSGLQVDLRVLERNSYGAAMHYFTGSQMHNIAIRDRAKRSGLRVNEYGVFTEPAGERVGGATEQEVFAAVKLPFIAPELRENRGEIEAAEAGMLPDLIALEQLRGDLHTRGERSGGDSSISEIAKAASSLDYEYLAITPWLGEDGMSAADLPVHASGVRELEQDLGAITLLAGAEIPIGADGSLGPAADGLGQLDWVVASVRESFDQDRDQMTQRLIHAMETKAIDCIAGQILGQREPYSVDLDAVLQAAKRLGVALELHADPLQHHLDANHCRQAHELGVPIAISSAAGSVEALSNMAFGLYTARRGWLEAGDVLNSWSLDQIRSWRSDRRS